MMTNVEAVQEAMTAFQAAFNRADIECVLSVWDDDFVDMPEGLSLMRGPEAFARRREMIMARFQEHEATLQIRPAEYAALGDEAVLVHGNLTVTMKHRRSKHVSHLRKRFMEVWIRSQRGWVVKFEMSNSEPGLGPNDD